MERRVFERINKKLQVKFWSGGMNYTGITTDVSENGMFVGTKKKLLTGALLDMEVILPNGDSMRVPVKVKRTMKTGDSYNYNIYENGLGVQLVSEHQRYEKFIKSFKTFKPSLR